MTETNLPIESGSTGEWRARIGIFLLMCTAFSLWFAYDGFIGYPRKNRESIRQALPEKPDKISAGTSLTTQSLKALVEKASGAGGGLKLVELKAALGEPIVEQKKEYTYVGSQIVAVVQLADGKVASVRSSPVGESQRVDAPNYRVTAEQLQRVSAGMTEDELSRFLGEPTKREERRLWYAATGAYASFDIDSYENVRRPTFHALEPSEGDIFIQKVLAGGLGILSIFVAIKWLRIMSLKVRLDEDGLTFNDRRIAWDQMKGIETDQYLDKGWLDLVYTQDGAEELQRLDSYHIDRFRDIVQTLCARKGFVLPRPPEAPTSSSSSDHDSSAV